MAPQIVRLLSTQIWHNRANPVQTCGAHVYWAIKSPSKACKARSLVNMQPAEANIDPCHIMKPDKPLASSVSKIKTHTNIISTYSFCIVQSQENVLRHKTQVSHNWWEICICYGYQSSYFFSKYKPPRFIEMFGFVRHKTKLCSNTVLSGLHHYSLCCPPGSLIIEPLIYQSTGHLFYQRRQTRSFSMGPFH